MNKNCMNWKGAVAIAALAGSALAVQQAQAGCGSPEAAGAKPAVFRSGAPAGRLLKTGFNDFDLPFRGAPYNTAEITGLWRFIFISDGTGSPQGPPATAPADSGFVTWHDDGTELMNSGRVPASGSFCMGVWKQIGPSTYKLNHWAMSWIPGYVPGMSNSWSGSPPTGVGGVDQAFKYAGPTNITETVKLSRDGNHYTGTFTIKAYAPKPGSPDLTEPDTATEPFVINGTVSGTRVTVN